MAHSFSSGCLTWAAFFVLLASLGCAHDRRAAKKAADAEVVRAVNLYKERNFADAVVILEKVVAEGKSSVEEGKLLTIIGNCYDGLEQYEKALEFHERSIALNPNDYQAHTNRGVACRHLRRYDEAAESYAKALAIQPGYAELHVNLGALAIQTGKNEEAVKHLEHGISLDDQMPVAHANLAIAYARVGRFEDADRELDKAVQLGYWNREAAQQLMDDARSGTKEEAPSKPD